MRKGIYFLALLLITASGSYGAPLTDLYGQPFEPDEPARDGRCTVLVFWQSWCVACAKEAPVMAEAARTYVNSARFFGVVSGPDNVVNESKVRAFAEKHRLPYPQLRDRDLALTKKYDVTGTPTIIVLDAAGRMRYNGHAAPRDWNEVFAP